MSGVERQFWESFEGWARRRMAQRLAVAVAWRALARDPRGRRGACSLHGEQIEAAREVRLGLAASIARGSAMGLPK